VQSSNSVLDFRGCGSEPDRGGPPWLNRLPFGPPTGRAGGERGVSPPVLGDWRTDPPPGLGATAWGTSGAWGKQATALRRCTKVRHCWALEIKETPRLLNQRNDRGSGKPAGGLDNSTIIQINGECYRRKQARRLASW